MKTRIQKWGNSLAVRIPKIFATEVGLEDDATVEVSLVGGKLVITPIEEPMLTLEDLLVQITDENLHQEFDIGNPVGKEIW